MGNNSIAKAKMLDEYDLSSGSRGKYVDRVAARRNVIKLDPDVAEVFTDSESVNQDLRGLVPVIARRAKKVRPN